MCARGSKPGGFYRESLRSAHDFKDEARVDVAELKRRLIEEIRRRPGELHLVLQASKILLQAEAVERRSGRGRPEEIAEEVGALLEGLGEQLLPGEKK